MLAIFRYLLSSAVMSHPHLHRRPSPPARPACLSAAALSARFRANFSARILPLGSTLAWRYTLFLEIWFVSWLTVSFLLAAAISQRIPPRCAAKKRLACPFFRTNSPLLTLILFDKTNIIITIMILNITKDEKLPALTQKAVFLQLWKNFKE